MLTSGARKARLIPHRLYSVVTIVHIFATIPLVIRSLGLFVFITERRVTYLVGVPPGMEWESIALVLSIIGTTLSVIHAYRTRNIPNAGLFLTPYLLSLVCLSGVSFLWPLVLMSCLISLAVVASRDERSLEISLYVIFTTLSMSWILRTLYTVWNYPLLTLMVNIAPYVWGLLQPVLPLIYLTTLIASLLSVILGSRNREAPVELTRGIKPKPKLGSIDIAYLLMGITLSLVLYTLPHTNLINPLRRAVTEDLTYYARWLRDMELSGDPIGYASSTDRPFYLLMLYAMKKLLGVDEWTTSVLSGWIWSPILTASLWFLTNELYGPNVSKWVALLTPMSHQSLAFLYGGFQANQLNLAVLFSAAALAARPKGKRVAALLILFSLSPFIHIWSWLHVGGALLGWLAYEYLVRSRLLSFRLLITMFAVYFTVLLTRSHVVLSLPQRVEGIASGLSSPLRVYLSLGAIFSYYLWGSLASPMILTLALIYQVAYRAKRSPDLFDWLGVSTLAGTMIFSGSIPLVCRLCINTPVQVIAARVLSKGHPLPAILNLITTASFAVYLVVNSVPT